MQSSMEELILETNEYQTPLTKSLLQSLPSEIQDQLLDFVYNVPFIQNLISPNRPRAKDLPRDEEGKIIVDLINPHILEDMDYFRESAIHFEKHGCYTFLRPNPNPNSEFGKWLKREVLRCLEGCIRPSDGEWVTGDMYYFLNYSPIKLTEIREGNSKIGDRVKGLPKVWEGIYWRFHYLHQARNGGKYNEFIGGNHCAELAKRGCGKSYTLASLMSKRIVLGESKKVKEEVVTILTAYVKEYLAEKDGTLSKFVPMIDHVGEYTQFPRARYKDAIGDMVWQYGYKDVNTGRIKGSKNIVMGLSVKEEVGKIRGKRGYILIEEYGSFPNLLSVYSTLRPSVEDGDITTGLIYMVGCVCKGTKVIDSNGNIKNIEDIDLGDSLSSYLGSSITKEEVTYIQQPSYKECVRIECSNGYYLECSKDHPILKLVRGKSKYTTFELADNLKIGDSLVVPKVTSNFGNYYCKDAYLLGALLGDGSYSNCNCPTLSITTNEQYEYFNSNYSIGISKLYSEDFLYAQIYFRGIVPLLKHFGMWGTCKEGKKMPNSILNWDKNSISEFLAGYFDADGNIQIVKGKYRSIKLTCKYKEPLDTVKFLLEKFGISSHILEETKPNRTLKSKVNNKEYSVKGIKVYVLYINTARDVKTFNENIQLKLKYKKERLDSYNVGFKDVNLYNNIPFKLNTTNNKGKKLEGKVYNNITTVHVKSIIDIGVQRVYNLTANTTHTYITNGFISSNTSGDKESDFEAAQEIMYHPDGYNVYSLPNVYDKPSTGGQSFCFFFPGYINRSGTFNKDGVSDVIAALISILQARHKIKYNSSDPGAITKAIAEIPITPQEAILRTSFSLFPTQDLIQRLAQIDSDPKSLTDVYSGQLIFNANNDVEFFPTSIPPIRDFPHKDNKIEGCWEIFAMPERDSNGKIPQGRYIASYDPYENDQSETMSLGCVLILDTWTDTIVAERTGRTALVDNFHEECRKGCLFYNARCLYEAHPYDQVVYTPEGERLWGDIKVGDKLFSPTKGIVTVIDIPVEGEDDIYEITLSDGRKVQSSSNHIWSVYKGTSKSLINITTNDLVKLGTINKYNQHIFYIPEHGGVQFNSSNLPIDPYTMGLILSEGSIRGSHCTKNRIQISSSFGDMEFYRSDIPYTVKNIGNKGYSWNLTIHDCKNIMQKYGLYGTDSHTKFIPKDYLYSNRIQRMELLKGLMDGDGCARTNGASIFITCSRQLAKDIMLLVRSLGIKCWLQTSTKGTFRVAIASWYNIFKLPRKVEGQHIYRPQSRGSKANSILNKTAIVDIKYVGKKKCKCVTVSSEDGLYLIGDYVVTHNCNKKGSYAYFSKMNSLYLLADTPEYLKDKQLIKISGIGNSSKGVNATAHINKYARDLITNWLTKPVTKVMHTEEEEKEVTMFNLYNIKARALLKELSMWNMNGNFDRVSSLGMLMLYREHTLILTGGDPSRVSKSKIKTLADDPYFEKNYKKKRLHGN